MTTIAIFLLLFAPAFAVALAVLLIVSLWRRARAPRGLPVVYVVREQRLDITPAMRARRWM